MTVMRERSRVAAAASAPSVVASTGRARSIADGLTFRRLGVDDLSNVRYLHGIACRCLSDEVGEDDVADYVAIASSPAYSDLLLSQRHILAFCGDELVGSAGWSFGDASAPVARLSSVFVHPLFARLGIARRLVAQIEADARNLGFERLEAPLPTHAGRFLRRLGFVAEAGEGIIARAAPGLALSRRLKAAAARPTARRSRRLSVVGHD